MSVIEEEMLATIARRASSEAYARCAYLYVTIKWLRSVSIKQMMINHFRGSHISSQQHLTDKSI